jgi:hypothetical protein
MDAWTSATSLHCVTTPGLYAFANAYENWSADTAVNSATAVHACVLASLGLPTTLPPNDERIPHAKVTGFTTDTTAVRHATVRAVSRCRLFEGCIWVPCYSHVGNLFFLDQVKEVKCIKELVVSTKVVADVFRTQAFRKIFLQ